MRDRETYCICGKRKFNRFKLLKAAQMMFSYFNPINLIYWGKYYANTQTRKNLLSVLKEKYNGGIICHKI